MERREFVAALAGAALAATAGCGGGGEPAPTWTSTRWPEAESLFHQEPRWLGGDGVYSIDLGGDRLLWLFGDSFIATTAALRRDQSKMVRNSLAIQTGRDPLTATMRFHWHEGANGPDSFFRDAPRGRWLWPGHGQRVGSRLLLWQMVLRAVSGGLGFAGDGWQVQQVLNPDDDPSRWQIETIAVPNRFDLSVGSAVVVESDWLYVYATPNDRPSAVYLARWPLSAAVAGTLGQPSWWQGHGQWVAQDQLTARPQAVLGALQTEFNVHPLPALAPQVMLHTAGFGQATLHARTAAHPEGPWSAPALVYRPPENDWPGVMIYSAKLHPALTCPGAAVVGSYSVNSFQFSTLVTDSRYYYPRLLKLTPPQPAVNGRG